MTDYIKNYMAMNLEAERNLALNADHTSEGLKEIAEDTVNSVSMGAKRALWRSSYFFDGYEDVNKQINHEDSRMWLAIVKAVKEHGFILNNGEIYVEKALKNKDSEEIIMKLSKISSKFVATGATKLSITFAIANIISRQFYFNAVIKKGYEPIQMLYFLHLKHMAM